MAKTVHVIAIGKLKDSQLESLEQNYLKRINLFQLKITETKAKAEDPEFEAKEVLEKLKNTSGVKILLTEHGHCLDTHAFKNQLQQDLINSSEIFFILAGALGPHPTLSQSCNRKFSLSPLTFPHQIARLLLIEQIYRAQTLIQNHPYHH